MTAFSNVPTYGSAAYAPQKRNSWGAIFAGSIIVLGIQLLLGTLGTAIGLSVLTGSPETETAKGVGIGAMIWWVITGLIALFIGGWVAGRLCGFLNRMEGLLHGAVTWSLSTLAAVLLLTTVAGTLVSGAWNVVSTTANTVVQASPQPAATTPPPADINETARRAPAAAAEAAKKAAGPSAGAAWGIFAMLLLGLGAAAAGGAVGVRYEHLEVARPGEMRPGIAA